MKWWSKRGSRRRSGIALVTALAVSWAAACNGSGGGDGNGPGEDDGGDGGIDPTFDPSGTAGECNVDALLSVESYAAKVKGLLTGLGVNQEELAALLAADDTQAELGDLVDTWVDSPEADEVLMRFFMTAFQQTGGDVESFFYLQGRNAASTGRYSAPNSPLAHEMLNQNFAESFARTAVRLVRAGRSFDEVLTTTEIEMTTAQKVFLAYKDDVVVHDDESKTVRHTAGDIPTITLVPNAGQAPPPAESFNPSSPNFMRFYHGRLTEGTGSCAITGPITIDTTSLTDGDWRLAAGGEFGVANFLYMMMMGRHESIRRHNVTPNCNTGARNRAPVLDREDFYDWHTVSLRKADSANPATKFWRLNQVRNATELRLESPQAGFLTRMGFFSTWPNNEDNSSRVTLNQMLIVALGSSFDGEAVTDFTPEGLDQAHAAPGTSCFGCHQTLDPMRDYVRASLTNFYGEQLDEERQGMEATFIFGGVQQVGTGGIEEFAQILAEHPAFPGAWIQKLCYFANSEACPPGAELDRIVAAFTDSGLDFRVALRELFSSPLITGESCVADVDAGTEATIARRSGFCAKLSNRLGIDDICGGLTLPDDADDLQNDMRRAMASVPDDSFSRSLVEPLTISETGLFIRANREVACTVAAENAFDQAYADASAEEVLDHLVTNVMGLPANDGRHDEARAILEAHVAEAQADADLTATEDEALRSAFIIACLSPSTAGVGF
ncbi:MAG: hypothetical protein AAF715_02530 [Myxococcota bacterium]